jgi:hypothetical protein
VEGIQRAKKWIKPILPRFVFKAIWKYREIRDTIDFLRQQRRKEFKIPERPMLDAAEMPVFCRMLENCRRYLEYGSGGSTVLAARLNKPFTSADTDQYFLMAVQRRIGSLGPDQHLVHADIGWTKPYGYPLFTTALSWRVKKWRAYGEYPWRYVEDGFLPDLVMIDGRFRVAAALTSCLHLANAPESRILVDDYSDRVFYHEIEAYARLVGVAGRMAIFQPLAGTSPAIEEAIDRYSLDWR